MGSTERNASARSWAEALFGKERTKDDEILQARDKERQEEAAKTARLRAQRLEKEKSEAEANAAASRRKPTR